MKLLNYALSTAKLAGEEVMKIRGGKDLDSRLKSDGTLVTKADEASEEIFLNLGNVTGIPVLTEEMSKNRYQQEICKYNEAGFAWIVDPLDGTKEYGKGLDEFAISVALVNREKVILGVVYAPAKNWMMYAVENKGAYKLDLKTETETETRIKTTDCTNLEDMTLLVSSSELNKKAYPDYARNLKRLGYSGNDPRIKEMGSTTLKTALIAAGEGDYNFTFTSWDQKKNKMRKTKEWDIAATSLLVQEAGGMMTDCRGLPFVFGKFDPVNQYGIFTSNSQKNHHNLLQRVVPSANYLERIKEAI
ncbi:3'(2'),5'-bisphosphate nucleotidase CysQ [Candidatus Woesearchaeota archaeon]|jgi:3'(2'), 5'-bisphosphate nucleotidase|nr:3'(2'),5'-bisphosphate nucleotidase CysQ [Candidatus Woesearchaeota archaeon]MBT5272380.1 3'(2'),5'-bisphosphate nucleotidase CysQ [Candidatus Woesearchaeota archaeon]MBT6040991.1 3'(2'),5'-bisphosphate nucleotidase CysQ [Candidatus Woesearchaeota archaeon]MBT6336652.1 3'(2'),5'-bisphosphate nucleotidase CysQ [Candidatus Woesearchaeota archaeon]MBT7927542.1 3'(2'),5'-bisphosphate nucleotidase CysQ [Candidatus Woesearchaeota archaeon]